MVLIVSHVDTCLPCYVLDHCNGDDEALFGVPVSGSDRLYHVKRALKDEVRATGDKIPERYSDADVNAAIDEVFRGFNPFKVFDSSLETANEYGESVYAWFRITWDD